MKQGTNLFRFVIMVYKHLMNERPPTQSTIVALLLAHVVHVFRRQAVVVHEVVPATLGVVALYAVGIKPASRLWMFVEKLKGGWKLLVAQRARFERLGVQQGFWRRDLRRFLDL
jgi:hypothetical protein